MNYKGTAVLPNENNTFVISEISDHFYHLYRFDSITVHVNKVLLLSLIKPLTRSR